ncbi:MAG: Ig-like domain-containing protein [Candidatus Bathyarchaeia archaeon]
MKIHVLPLIVAFLIASSAIAGIYYYATLPSSKPSPSPSLSGRYLTFRNGTETKVFLANSQLSYSENNSAVIISGEIRNDYSWEYYFPITGDLYTLSGERIEGQKWIFARPIREFTVARVAPNSSCAFELRFRHEGRDIKNYELFILAIVEVPFLYPIIYIYPFPNSANVPPTTNISIAFSRQPIIYEFTVKPEIKVEKTIVGMFGNYWNVQWTWLLAEPLKPKTTYTITIVYGQDVHPEGYPFPVKETFTWNFTTSDIG